MEKYKTNVKYKTVFSLAGLQGTNVENYRPISILSYISKIFERFLHVSSPNQFGYQKNLSTSDALLSFTEFQYNVLNNLEFSVHVFVDFTNAFDSVDHAILLDTIDIYGVRGLPLAFLKSHVKHYSDGKRGPSLFLSSNLFCRRTTGQCSRPTALSKLCLSNLSI